MQSYVNNDLPNISSNQDEDTQYIWRRNCPYLYDTMLSYTLEWPTLTIDWLPNSYKSADGSYSVHKVIYGTHTSGQEPNYLIISEVHIGDLETNDDLMNNESFAEYSYSPENTNMSSVQFEVKAKLNHPEEVNKALHMPEHPFIIASRVVNGDILVFDYSKHESFPTDELVHPQLLLKGHSKEGYAMDWGNGTSINSYLISGGSDNIIHLWDFNKSTSGILNSSARSQFNYVDKTDTSLNQSTDPYPPILEPIKSIYWHSSDVNDLKWHPSTHSIFGSVSDDGNLAIWDLRTSTENSPNLFINTESGINTLSFNQFVPTMISTGNVDGIVQIWDVRNTREELFSLNYHSEKPVVCMEWSKWSPSILVTGGVDGKVVVWDLYKNHYKNENSSKIQNTNESIVMNNPANNESTKLDPLQDSTNPNVLFVHYGHTAPITSISWNPNEHGDPLLIASASEDNTIQFWQFSDTFI
ncbi:WD repeat protein [Cryptosporidium canis]|uniref:WD repeat protein n=1 Tax=Cryptosporidium canis TaxID=195482 RepID=A0ABQ8P7M8_9CRYT|nr:WD repeat protein [Cryptosporidium canis]KAJ1613859.1 WD repeat protein [Cryptosporidium canis]